MSTDDAADLSTLMGQEARHDDNWANDIGADIPVDLPAPISWRVMVMPLEVQEKTKGGIYLPDVAKEIGSHNTFIGRLVALGPAAYKHRRYRECGLTPKDFPQVGDLVLYSRSTPMRIEFKGVKLLVMNDDHIIAKAHSVERYKIHV